MITTADQIKPGDTFTSMAGNGFTYKANSVRIDGDAVVMTVIRKGRMGYSRMACTCAVKVSR